MDGVFLLNQDPSFQVAWNNFAEGLQKCFVSTCSMDRRPLSQQDMMHLQRSQFLKLPPRDPNPYVSYDAFVGFWSWFAAFMHVVSKVPDLWADLGNRTILGVVSRQVAEEQLRDQLERTFVLRMSESRIGNLALGYVTHDAAGRRIIVHSLIDGSGEGFSIVLQGDGLQKQKQSYHTLQELVMKCRPLEFLRTPYGTCNKVDVFSSGPDDDVPQ